MTARIITGDCREVLAALPEASVDAIVTDPPYHLTTGKKGGTGPASVNLESPYGRARIGTGFMGMKWDGGDVAMRPKTWAECLRVLKPGGYLLAFGGTRTYHRLACAIEDAGFEIRDQIGWAFGSGFPKSHNGEWGGTALKPAWEPICMARKPLIGTVEANWRAHGTGALNIDGCRVGSADETARHTLHTMRGGNYENHTPSERIECGGSPLGRWPANLIHDGSEEVLAAFPQAPGMQGPVRPNSGTGQKTNAILGKFATNSHHDPRGDTGSAARFFYCAKASREDRNEGLPSGDKPAVGTGATMREREDADWPARNGNHHPTVKPTDLMRYLCRLVTPKGGTVLDPFMGSGSTGKAAVLEGFDFIGIELSPEYATIAEARIDHARRQGMQEALL